MNCYYRNQRVIGIDVHTGIYYEDRVRPYTLFLTETGGHRYLVDFPNLERAMEELGWYAKNGYEEIVELRYFTGDKFIVRFGIDPTIEYIFEWLKSPSYDNWDLEQLLHPAGFFLFRNIGYNGNKPTVKNIPILEPTPEPETCINIHCNICTFRKNKKSR